MDETTTTPKKKIANNDQLPLSVNNMLDSAEFQEKDNFSWNSLPIELFLSIFEYLSHTDIQQVRLVCKHWYDLAQFPELLNRSKLIINPKNLSTLYEYLSNDHRLSRRLKYDTMELHEVKTSAELDFVLQAVGPNIHKLRLHSSPVSKTFNNCMPELEELTVAEELCPEDNAVSLIDFRKLKNLKSLDIPCHHLIYETHDHHPLSNLPLRMERLCLEVFSDNDEMILNALYYHSCTLTHLEMTIHSESVMISQWKQLFRLFRKLETLKLTAACNCAWIKEVIECLPKEAPLRHCDLSGGLQVDDSLLKHIVNTWPASLACIELMFLDCLTDDSIRYMSKLRNSLTTLKISRCSNVTLMGLIQGLAAENNIILKNLALSQVKIIDSVCLELLLHRLPQLTSLSLESMYPLVSACTLQNIFKYQTKLKNLTIKECMRLDDKSISGRYSQPIAISNLKGLQALSLRSCLNTEEHCLKGFKFKELRKLFLSYFPRVGSKCIQELVKNCPVIEDLIITSLPMIDDEAILHVALGLPRLKRLYVNNCSQLTPKSLHIVIKHCKSLKELYMCGMNSEEAPAWLMKTDDIFHTNHCF